MTTALVLGFRSLRAMTVTSTSSNLAISNRCKASICRYRTVRDAGARETLDVDREPIHPLGHWLGVLCAEWPARPASSDGRAGFARVLGSPSHVNCWGRSDLDDGALCPARESGECADSCSAKHGFRGRYYSEPAHLVGHRTRICDFGVVGIDGFWRPLHGKPNPSVGRSAAVAKRLLGKSNASL